MKTSGWPAAVIVTCLAGSVGCVASRGPLGGDAGEGGHEGGPHKEASATCPAPSGGNDLSFDLECQGECDVKTHFDVHVATKDEAYPGCGIGGANLEIADFTDPKSPVALSGTGATTIALSVTEYTGPRTYKLEPGLGNNIVLFDLVPSATWPTCEDSGTVASVPDLLIEETTTIPDSGVELDASEKVPPPTCEVKVETDCTADDGRHTVTGTLSCSFPNHVANWDCTITGGKFAFGACLP